MPELNAEQTKGVLDALAWDWDVEPGIPSPEDAAGELLAYVADIIAQAQREAAQAVLDAVEGLHRPIRACDKPDCTLVHCAYDTGAFPCQTVQKARAAAAKYGVGTAAGEAERTEPHNCDGCVDLALAANNTRLPRRSDGHFVDCAAAGGDGR